MAKTLILISGYAGSGKTHIGKDVARRLPSCYLDKDTLSSPFVERLLTALKQPTGDRDSLVYRQQVRPLEYEALTATGFEAAALGSDVLLSAPFLAQLVDAAWTSQLADQATQSGVRVRTIWVACNLATLRQRMVERNSPRDLAKLAAWNAYAAEVDEQLDLRFEVEAFRFNNSDGNDYDEEMARLLSWLCEP